MEKINALIDKLQELKNSNADLQSISYYVQMLQAEVLHVRTQQKAQEQQQQVRSHIAVIMPAPAQTITITEPAPAAYANGYTNSNNTTYHTTTAVPEKTPEPPAAKPQPVETEVIKPAAVIVDAQTFEPKPVVAVQPAAVPETRPAEPKPALVQVPLPAAETRSYEPKPAPLPEKQPVSATLFEVETTAPAKKAKDNSNLRKEINELAAQTMPSLNEKLKQSKSEIGEKLGEMPVKDLRQAIGINDKFQFIQELFRGDVDMYERSIKTINEFHTLQEAEYWIERELKIRQGWLDDTRAVRHFYTLVKKRFS